MLAAFNSLRPDFEIFSTPRVASDNRAVIEVKIFEILNDRARIEGTASVFEGTLKIKVIGNDHKVHEKTVQVSLGAPDRGWWTVVIPISPDSKKITIEETYMTSTPSALKEQSMIVIDLLEK